MTAFLNSVALKSRRIHVHIVCRVSKFGIHFCSLRLYLAARVHNVPVVAYFPSRVHPLPHLGGSVFLTKCVFALDLSVALFHLHAELALQVLHHEWKCPQRVGPVSEDGYLERVFQPLAAHRQ